jgi:hypothetical protein
MSIGNFPPAPRLFTPTSASARRVVDPGAALERVMQRLTVPYDDEQRHDAALYFMRLPEPDFEALTWLSEHRLAKDSSGFERYADSLGFLDLSWPEDDDHHLTQDDLRCLRKWLASSHAPASTELDLSGMPLGQPAGDILAGMIDTGRLCGLHLSCAELPDIRALCKAMEGNTSVTSLTLSGNSGAGFGDAIASMLQHSLALTTLSMARCSLAPDEVQKIATAILSGGTLQTLDLSHNPWGTIGLKAISELVEAPTSLSKLTMVNEDLQQTSADAFGAFCEALAANATLQHLSLGSNSWYTEANTNALHLALKENKTLEHVELCGHRAVSHPAQQKTILEGLAAHGGLRSMKLDSFDFTEQDCLILARLLAHADCLVSTLAMSHPRWPRDESSHKRGIPRSLVDAILTNHSLTELKIGPKPLNAADAIEVENTLKKNQRLHLAAGRAVVLIGHAGGHLLPRDLAAPLSDAFSAVASGWALQQIVDAASGLFTPPART